MISLLYYPTGCTSQFDRMHGISAQNIKYDPVLVGESTMSTKSYMNDTGWEGLVWFGCIHGSPFTDSVQ